MKKMRTLYFEGMGWSKADISRATIGNCRIRSAFHLDNGRPVFLEIIGANKSSKEKRESYKWEYTGFVDACFYITNDKPNNDQNLHRLLLSRNEEGEREAEEFFRRKMSAEEYKTPEESKKEWERACEYVSEFVEGNAYFEYSEEGILKFLSSIGATFDEIKVSNEESGYNVLKRYSMNGVNDFNYGDECGNKCK